MKDTGSALAPLRPLDKRVGVGTDTGQKTTPGLNDGVGPTTKPLGQRGGRLITQNTSIKDGLLKCREPRVISNDAKGNLIRGKPKLKIQPLINPRGRVLNGGDGMPAKLTTSTIFTGHTPKAVTRDTVDNAPQIGAETGPLRVIRVIPECLDQTNQDVLNGLFQRIVP